MKKNVDYFIYNYFFYIHKLSSNRKSNRTAILGLVGLSTLNGLDRIVIFSNRCYRFGLNIMLKSIQTNPQTPLLLLCILEQLFTPHPKIPNAFDTLSLYHIFKF